MQFCHWYFYLVVLSTNKKIVETPVELEKLAKKDKAKNNSTTNIINLKNNRILY